MELYKKVFIDTNSLIYHTFENFDKQKHQFVKSKLEYFDENEYKIYISTQILKEFFATSTNSKFFNEPLTIAEAILKLNEFKDSFIVLEEKNSTIKILENLISKYSIKKQKVYDTNIVATMVQNGIENLLTLNVRDFEIFDEVEIIE